MRKNWIQVQRRLIPLATGGITLGVLQGFGMVNFALLFTQALSRFFSVLVTALLGGNIQALLNQFVSYGRCRQLHRLIRQPQPAVPALREPAP